MTTPTTLRPTNVASDWIELRLWRNWDYPTNAIRGESRRQDEISKLLGVKHRSVRDRLDPMEVAFVREPGNVNDPLACRAEVGGHMVGYLARECAEVLAPQVDTAGAKTWRVCGAVVGGSKGAPSYGVHVWLNRRLTDGPEWSPPAWSATSVTYLGPHQYENELRGDDAPGYLHCLAGEFVAAVDHRCPTCDARPLQPCLSVEGHTCRTTIHWSRLALGEEAIRREAAAIAAAARDAPAKRPGESSDRYRKRTGRYPPQWSSYDCRAQDAQIEEARRSGNRDYLRRWGFN